jgi:hypothetical protein
VSWGICILSPDLRLDDEANPSEICEDRLRGGMKISSQLGLMIDEIGATFLLSNDTKRLAAWYRDCLGIVPQGEDAECSSI